MGQTKADQLQAREFIRKSNTEAGRRILANAPPDVPGYREFIGFLIAVFSGKAKVLPSRHPCRRT